VNRRAHVQIIDPQKTEITSTKVDKSAADELLKKYYIEQQQKLIDDYDVSINNNTDFRGFANIPMEPHDPRVHPDKDGMYTNTTWDGDQESGINFEIKINSSMPLPKR